MISWLKGKSTKRGSLREAYDQKAYEVCVSGSGSWVVAGFYRPDASQNGVSSSTSGNRKLMAQEWRLTPRDPRLQ